MAKLDALLAEWRTPTGNTLVDAARIECAAAIETWRAELPRYDMKWDTSSDDGGWCEEREDDGAWVLFEDL